MKGWRIVGTLEALCFRSIFISGIGVKGIDDSGSAKKGLLPFSEINPDLVGILAGNR